MFGYTLLQFIGAMMVAGPIFSFVRVLRKDAVSWGDVMKTVIFITVLLTMIHLGFSFMQGNIIIINGG